MTLEEVKKILKGEMIVAPGDPQMDINMACAGDLMSDILAFTKPCSLLLTGLMNPQVIRTVEVADIKAICFVRGKKPDEATIRLAKSKGIPLLATDLPMFESCGLLYKNGLIGCSEYKG